MFLLYILSSIFLTSSLHGSEIVKNHYCYMSLGENFNTLKEGHLSEQLGIGFRYFSTKSSYYDILDCNIACCKLRRENERHYMLFFPRVSLYNYTPDHASFYYGVGLTLLSLKSKLAYLEQIGGYPLKIYEEEERKTLLPILTAGYEISRTNNILSFIQVDLYYPEETLYCKNYMAVCTFNVGF